jgi:hypothetical protein
MNPRKHRAPAAFVLKADPNTSDVPSEPRLSLVSPWDDEFALEFAMSMDGFTISVEMGGGVMQVKGDAVVGRGPKVTRVPLEMVMRFEDAAELRPRLVGELRGSDRGT